MSEETPTFTEGPEFQMRDNARRLDAQAEILTTIAFDVRRAADNHVTRALAGEADAARAAVQAAAAALRNIAQITERYGEIVEQGSAQ
jgi:predicted translin family RNA/ssDNA-binding protein